MAEGSDQVGAGGEVASLGEQLAGHRHTFGQPVSRPGRTVEHVLGHGDARHLVVQPKCQRVAGIGHRPTRIGIGAAPPSRSSNHRSGCRSNSTWVIANRAPAVDLAGEPLELGIHVLGGRVDRHPGEEAGGGVERLAGAVGTAVECSDDLDQTDRVDLVGGVGATVSPAAGGSRRSPPARFGYRWRALPAAVDSSPRAVASRGVRWGIVSTPRCCCTKVEVISELIRARAIGLSLMSKNSTPPAAWISAAVANSRSRLAPLGGSSSTDTTHSPCLQLAAPAGSRRQGRRPGGRQRLAPGEGKERGTADRRPRAGWPRCDAAGCRSSRRSDARPRPSPGRRTPPRSPPTRPGRARDRRGTSGRPVFGWMVSGVIAASRISRRPASADCGPRLQLMPTAATPRPRQRRATSTPRAPVTVSPSSCTVIWAITGRSHWARTAPTADHQLLERRERLQHDQVDAAALQHGGLLAVQRRAARGVAADVFERACPAARSIRR